MEGISIRISTEPGFQGDPDFLRNRIIFSESLYQLNVQLERRIIRFPSFFGSSDSRSASFWGHFGFPRMRGSRSCIEANPGCRDEKRNQHSRSAVEAGTRNSGSHIDAGSFPLTRYPRGFLFRMRRNSQLLWECRLIMRGRYPWGQK